MTNPTKTCSRCNQAKPLSAFKTDQRKPDGKASSCKSCNTAVGYVSTGQLAELGYYDQARALLTKAKAVDEVKAILDKTVALKEYARRASDRTGEIDFAEIRFHAERRLGEMIAAQKQTVGLNAGTRGQLKGRDASGAAEKAAPEDTRPTLADVGITSKLSSHSQKMAAIPEEQFQARIDSWREEMAAGQTRVTMDLMRIGAEAEKAERRETRERVLGGIQLAQPVRPGFGWDRQPSDNALNVGKAAEHLVCADALMRGYEAFLSGQGAPYDLIIEKDGRLFKIQVKGAQAPRNVNSKGLNARVAYSFCALRRGKEGEGPRLTKQDADIVACVALDTLRIAYLPVFECSSTIQLEPEIVADNGYTRTYERPIGDYPLDAAVARVISENHYTELQKTFPPFPRKRYGVILADPPWSFATYSDKGMDRSADNHYPTLDVGTLCGIGPFVPAADDCALFLWATVPMLPDALKVMKAWGFDYKSSLVWVKDRVGTGYWFRNQHELLLVGTRGDRLPAPAMGTQFSSVIEAPVGEHSEKPDVFYTIIETYFPTLPKIELNARRARAGWTAWGLEAPQHATGEPPDIRGSQHAEADPDRETGLIGGSPVVSDEEEAA
jgi:N6-adenosine-specific RNA methylase IME4